MNSEVFILIMLVACHHRHGQKGLVFSFVYMGVKLGDIPKSLNAECFVALITPHH